jgi:hypothetical protein
MNVTSFSTWDNESWNRSFRSFVASFGSNKALDHLEEVLFELKRIGLFVGF